MTKAITFVFRDPSFLPDRPGSKLAIFKIIDGKKILYDYGFSEWDGKEFGLPLAPYPDMIIELYAWAETVDPFYEQPRLIRANRN